jgi:hypothetical protein
MQALREIKYMKIEEANKVKNDNGLLMRMPKSWLVLREIYLKVEEEESKRKKD